MEAVAKLNNCPSSPRKMKLLTDLIKGQKVSLALNMLQFSKKHASTDLRKLVLSAVSNWKAKNEGADIDSLVIKIAKVDQGTMMKRFRPAPFGRPYRIRKRSNHVTIILDTITK
jgi:large subunit ribosomal protein L22